VSEAGKHLVILQPSGRRGYVAQGPSLRAAARELAAEIESICAENATCGKCKVLVEEGDFARYNIRLNDLRRYLCDLRTGEMVAFGLPDQPTINTAYLPLMSSRGLTSAITNPLEDHVRKIIRASDVLMGRDPNAMSWIRAFRD